MRTTTRQVAKILIEGLLEEGVVSLIDDLTYNAISLESAWHRETDVGKRDQIEKRLNVAIDLINQVEDLVAKDPINDDLINQAEDIVSKGLIDD